MKLPLLLFAVTAYCCLCGCQSKLPNSASSTSTAASSQAAPQAVEPQEPVEPTLWTQFLVPSLNSIKDDWPKVEESLMKIEGVREVRHKPTMDETDDRVPDKVVLVKHVRDFNARQVVESLKEAGFEGASVKSF